MDGKTFAKFTKDTKLLDKKLTSTDVDIIFAKVKAKTERKINYSQFENGLKFLAEKKGVGFDDLADKVLSTGGPTYAGTKADKVKFHDDKSLYTGMYGKSATPAAAPGPDISKSSVLMDEKKAHAAPKKVMETKHAAASSLKEVFDSYAGGSGAMDGKTFAKLAKDTKILDKKLSATDVDLAFAKVKAKAERKITFAQF